MELTPLADDRRSDEPPLGLVPQHRRTRNTNAWHKLFFTWAIIASIRGTRTGRSFDLRRSRSVRKPFRRSPANPSRPRHPQFPLVSIYTFCIMYYYFAKCCHRGRSHVPLKYSCDRVKVAWVKYSLLRTKRLLKGSQSAFCICGILERLRL